MSIEAINWALNDAPGVPASLVAVLIGLANHARPDGTGAFPSQGTLAEYARKSDRAVRNDLKELMRLKLIVVSKDQRQAMHIRADVRPVVYDLPIHLKKDTTGSQLPPGSTLPVVIAKNEDETGQDGSTTGSTVPPGSGLPPGSTASNDRKPTSDEPTTKPTTKKTSSSSTPKRGTRIPADFKITPEMEAWGRANAPNIDGTRETQKFINYDTAAPGAKGVKLDWVATWRNWILNADDRQPRSSPQSASTPVVAAVPWCGTCSNPARQIENHIGALIPCPTCSPHRRTP